MDSLARRAKGPANCLAQAAGLGKHANQIRLGPTARQFVGFVCVIPTIGRPSSWASIPHISIIDFEAMPFANLAILLLKRHLLVMRILIANVLVDGTAIRMA